MGIEDATPESQGELPKVSEAEAEKIPVIATLSELYHDETSEEKIVLLFKVSGENRRVPIKFRELYWPAYNTIIEQAFRETSDIPDLYERTKQEMLMKAMITSVAGFSVSKDHEFWTKIRGPVGEGMRRAFFNYSGEFRVSEAMLKNLATGSKGQTPPSQDGKS